MRGYNPKKRQEYFSLSLVELLIMASIFKIHIRVLYYGRLSVIDSTTEWFETRPTVYPFS